MGLIKEGSGNSVTNINPLRANSSNHTIGVNEAVNTYQGLDPKSRRILVQGIVQAAAQSSVLQMFCVNPEEYHHQVIKLAEVMIKFVEEHS